MTTAASLLWEPIKTYLVFLTGLEMSRAWTSKMTSYFLKKCESRDFGQILSWHLIKMPRCTEIMAVFQRTYTAGRWGQEMEGRRGQLCGEWMLLLPCAPRVSVLSIHSPSSLKPLSSDWVLCWVVPDVLWKIALQTDGKVLASHTWGPESSYPEPTVTHTHNPVLLRGGDWKILGDWKLRGQLACLAYVAKLHTERSYQGAWGWTPRLVHSVSTCAHAQVCMHTPTQKWKKQEWWVQIPALVTVPHHPEYQIFLKFDRH